MAYIQMPYETSLVDTQLIYHEGYIFAQIRKLPTNIVFGFLYKGAAVLWVACQNEFVPYIFKSFFQSSIRYRELLRCNTTYNARLETYTWLTRAVSGYFCPQKRQHPTPR